jgi:hypothetical protein
MQKLTFDPAARVARATAPLPSIGPAVRPKLLDQEADFELPRKLWERWIPAKGKRAIVRAFTDAERDCVQRRYAELTRGLEPFLPQQRDRIRAPLHAMLGGFRSLRESGEDAETAVEVLLAVLRDFPAWAIEEACIRIARRDIEIDPPLDRRWAPSDSQIYAAVSAIVQPFRKALTTAQALLDAPVALPPAPSRAEPSRDRIEAPSRPQRPVPAEIGDGKHAQRVMEDLRRRKALAEANSQGTNS